MEKLENHLLLFKCVVGSTVYGTNTASSDVDVKGVYLQDAMDIACGKYVPQITLGKDETYYELSRFLELVSEKANPTLLEMLFVDAEHILYCHPAFDLVMDVRTEFITKKCKDSFGGMALSQIKKAKGTDKMMNREQQRVQRKTLLDFCQVTTSTMSGSMELTKFLELHELDQSQLAVAGIPKMKDCYQLYLDRERLYTSGLVNVNGNESNELKLCSVPKGSVCIGVLYYNKDGYSMHCKEYRLYTEWLNNRNMSRFVGKRKPITKKLTAKI